LQQSGSHQLVCPALALCWNRKMKFN
jgi:hypothetical protein